MSKIFLTESSIFKLLIIIHFEGCFKKHHHKTRDYREMNSIETECFIIPTSTTQVQESIKALKYKFSEITSDILESYKPQINTLFKQILQKIQGLQSRSLYDPSIMKDSYNLLIQNMNMINKKMISLLEIKQKAQLLKNDINSGIVFQQCLKNLQKNLKLAQQQLQGKKVLALQKEKQLAQYVCQQYKNDEVYLKDKIQITQLEDEIKKITSTINDLTLKIKQTETSTLQLNIEQEDLQGQYDSLIQNINELISQEIEQKQQKENNQKVYLLKQLLDQDIEDIQNKKKIKAFYLFDQNKLSQLEKKNIQSFESQQNILYYSSQISNFFIFKQYCFKKCLDTISKKIKEIKSLVVDTNNEYIEINIIVESTDIQNYLDYQQNIDDFISQILELKRSVFKLQVKFIDKSRGENLSFQNLQKQLVKQVSTKYQNIYLKDNSFDFSRPDQKLDKQTKKIQRIQQTQQQLSQKNKSEQKKIDKHINSLTTQISEKKSLQNQFRQNIDACHEKIRNLGRQKLTFINQKNDLVSNLKTKQTELSIKEQNLQIFQNQLKTLEKEAYLHNFQKQIDQAKRECQQIQKKILSLKSQQQFETKQIILQQFINKINKIYKGIKDEIFVLFSFIYEFSGQSSFLLLIFAQSFDSQLFFIEESLENSFQKVFGLRQETSRVVLNQIKVEIQKDNQNNLQIILEPKPQKTKQNIQQVKIFNNQDLLIKYLEDNIDRTK
ncbi:hypothetical protein ABPG72_018616 [Tetrahymena utriculariae]